MGEKYTPPEITRAVIEQQGEQARARRDEIATNYAISPEEAGEFRERLLGAIRWLGDTSSAEAIAEAFDQVFDDNDPRVSQLHQAFIQSALGKIKESIINFAPAELQTELAPLLATIDSSRGEGGRFNTLSQLLLELRQYEAILEKYGLPFEMLTKLFLAELTHYLEQQTSVSR